jgi:hypothetical protein
LLLSVGILSGLNGLPGLGHPAFPFIDQGKDLGYERERKRRKEERENPRGRGP